MMRFKSFFLVLTLVFLPGIASADLEAGFQAYEKGDYEAAVNAWLPLAEQGDVTAQFNLGQMYRLGKGVPRDDREAVKWYKLAAKQGSPHAQHNLRLMHRDGRANQQDYEEIFGSDAADDAVAAADTPPTLPSETAMPASVAPVTPPVESSMKAAAAPAAAAAMPDTTQMPVESPVEQPSLAMPDSGIPEDTTAMDSGMGTALPESSKTSDMMTAPAAPPAKSPPPTQTAMIDRQPPPARSGNRVSSDGWLQQLNPQDYVVQLVASADQRGSIRSTTSSKTFRSTSSTPSSSPT
jgi:hypothetical protein